jgi:hypothetical protein
VPKKKGFPRQAAGFIEAMDCLPVSRLPEGPQWTNEIKLDGYRLEAVRSAGRTTLYSRRQNVLNQKFYYITCEAYLLRSALAWFPRLQVLGTPSLLERERIFKSSDQ